tara:strand:- start:22220 stop:22780 length:561 start_codon:yes stop_codon:yes gene_type:complete
MTAGTASRVLRAPGRLVVNPTDLTLDYPYGGTEVGLTKLVALTSQGTHTRIPSEGLGGDSSDVLERSNLYVFVCFLRGWDDEAVEKFFAKNYVQGAVSGHAVFREPGDRGPGASVLAREVKLLYVPDDPVSNPALLIYRGVPDWGDGSELAFQRKEELGIPLLVELVRGATGKIVEVGRLADLSLT